MALSPRLAEIARLMRDPNALRQGGQPGEHRYDPHQPRVPAGRRDGGQWTKTGQAHAATTSASDRAQIDDDDAAMQSLVQQAAARPFPGPGPRPVPVPPLLALLNAALLYRYNSLSERNGPNQQAIIEFRARELNVGAINVTAAETLTREEVGNVCGGFADVRRLVDRSTIKMKATAGSMSAQQFGTAVHTDLAHTINNGLDSNATKLGLRAEVSQMKSDDDDVYYGKKGSIRIDILENAGRGVICVYDLKTGGRQLSLRRMVDLAEAASRAFPGVRIEKIIVTEVRPFQ